MNNQIADIFNSIADLLELKDENKFKISAYRNSARILQGLKEDVDNLIKNNEIENIKGIGKATSEKIYEFHKTGRITFFDELKKSFPDGLLELFQIKGLGPKKIRNLWNNLGVASIGELEYACKENRLLKLEGFGEKTQAKILEGIAFINKNKGFFLINKIYGEGLYLLEKIKKFKNIQNIEFFGAFRRFSETFEKIEILVSTENISEFKELLKKAKLIQLIISEEKNTINFITKNNFPAEIRICSDMEFPFWLHTLTGSEVYLKALDENFRISDITFKNSFLFKGNNKVLCKSENDIFTSLGLQFIPPELREGYNEIELAKNRKIPKLITLNEIKGVLHVHSKYSDGINSIEELVKECIEQGFEYLGICDHSKNAFYAHGLKEDEVLKQFMEINSLNIKYKNKIRILKGIESDILNDGSLDYDNDLLSKFDFIVASVHSNFTMSEVEMTERILNAIRNKYTTILGHATGRLLLSREPYKINLEKIIEECIKNKVIIELNSDEHRLDVSWKLLKNHVSKGLKIAINSDAHNNNSINNIKYGIMMARKAAATKNDIVNCLDCDSFLQYIKTKNKAT